MGSYGKIVRMHDLFARVPQVGAPCRSEAFRRSMRIRQGPFDKLSGEGRGRLAGTARPRGTATGKPRGRAVRPILERAFGESENSQKQGLPTRKAVNSLTPLLEPAAEKVQGGECALGPPEFEF